MSNRILRCLSLVLAFTFIAAACGGESEDGADTDDTTPDVSAPDDTTPDGTTPDDTTPDGTTPSGEGNYYSDPRGGIFEEFQQTYDRGDHPFEQIDAVCLAHDPAADRVDTDPGITADSIALGHIRSRLEDAVDIGFGIPVGDPKEMFDVLVDYINEECGGIRGRQIDLGYVEADLLGAEVEASRNQACLAMTEDHHSVIVMNSTGFQGSANLCIVEEQETAFITTQGQTEEYMERGEDRLISLSVTLEESLRFLALDLLESGALEGKSIGVASPNTPGQAEAVEAGLVNLLEDAGFEVVFDVLDCAGGTICSGGVTQSVTNMVNADVDVFFNVMNLLTAPGYISEMAAQGYEPGDVQFYGSGFNNAASELITGQIANDVAAGDLYNGAIFVDFRNTGDVRKEGYESSPFEVECNRVFKERNTIGADLAWDDAGDVAYGMVGSVCSVIRVAARAIYDAGDNPTVVDIQEALANLGPIDTAGMDPASIMPGKTQSADVLQTIDWEFPCTQPMPFTRDNGDPVCLTGRGDYRPTPR